MATTPISLFKINSRRYERMLAKVGEATIICSMHIHHFKSTATLVVQRVSPKCWFNTTKTRFICFRHCPMRGLQDQFQGCVQKAVLRSSICNGRMEELKRWSLNLCW